MKVSETVQPPAGVLQTGQPKRSVIGSVKWTVLSEIVSRAFPPLVTIILARILIPEDYGVVGVAAMVLSLLNVVWEAGLGRALIQTEFDINKSANCVFWSNLAVGTFVYLLVFTAAPWVGIIYHDTRISSVLRVLSLNLIIGALTTVQTALLQRELRFKEIFWSRFYSSFIPGMVSIPLAFLGSAHWALVAGTLAGSAVQTTILWRKSTWRPEMKYDIALAKRLFNFGVWALGESLLGWFYNWGDSAMLGAFLSLKVLGVYRTGAFIVGMVFSTTLGPITPILYSAFCRLQNDRIAFVAQVSRAIKVMTAIALPVGVGLYLTGDNLAHVIFGDKWQGLGNVIAVFGLLQAFSFFLTGVTTEAYKASGRPDIFPKLYLFALTYYIPIYLWAVPKGVDTFLWARLAIVYVSSPLHLFLMRRMLGFSWGFIWKKTWPQWLACFLMAVVVTAGKTWLWPCAANGHKGIGPLMLSTLTGVLVYVGTTWWVDRPFFQEMNGLLYRAVKRERTSEGNK